MIKKTLLPTNDVYIQFTEDELASIGAVPGTKFEARLHDNGSIELRPYVKIELDMKDWPREVLELIIKQSCEDDISANDIINNVIKQSIREYDDVKTSSKELLVEKDYLYNAQVDPNFTNNDTSICNS
jgi:hypothetical protein